MESGPDILLYLESGQDARDLTNCVTQENKLLVPTIVWVTCVNALIPSGSLWYLEDVVNFLAYRVPTEHDMSGPLAIYADPGNASCKQL